MKKNILFKLTVLVLIGIATMQAGITLWICNG